MAVLVGVTEGVSFSDVHPGVSGQGDEGRVEVATLSDHRIGPSIAWEWERGGHTGGTDDVQVLDDVPARDVSGIESEGFEESEGLGRQTVATALVPRERGLVDEDDVTTGVCEGDRCGDPCRSCTDDDDFGCGHAGDDSGLRGFVSP